MNTRRYTSFKEFSISDLNISSKSQLEDIIEDTIENINSIKSEIGMIAASTPKDIVPENEHWEPLEYVRSRLSNLFGDLWEYHSLLAKCYLIEDNFDNLTTE